MVDDPLTIDVNSVVYILDMLKKDYRLGQKPESGRTVSVRFLSEEEGPTRFIIVNASPCERIVPDPSKWAAYVGTYTVSEASTTSADTLTVRVDGGHLLLSSRKLNKTFTCAPIDDYRFASGLGFLEFPVIDCEHAPLLELWKTIKLTRIGEGSLAQVCGSNEEDRDL